MLQAGLAVLFVFAGATKFVMSAEDLQGDVNLPVAFIRFIGVCEVLGGIGLVAPAACASTASSRRSRHAAW
jgi:uncharacterized membrane protein